VASKYAEAYVLFGRACEHAESALKRLKQLSFPEEVLNVLHFSE
jgi:hypothetical protein